MSKRLVVRGATVIPVSHNPRVADILVEDGLITAIDDRIVPSPDAEVIDATGRYVFPGIIDTHTHVGMPLKDIVEKSGQFHADLRIVHAIQPNHYSLKLLVSGGTTTVKIQPGSGSLITGLAQTVKLKWGRPLDDMLIKGARQQLKFAVGENPASSAKREGRPPFTRQGQMAELREYLNEARTYDEARNSANPPPYDAGLETLADALHGTYGVDCHAYAAHDITNITNILAEFGIPLKQISHGVEAYRVAELLAAHEVSYGGWVDRWGFKGEAHDNNPWGLALMVNAGVNVVINTDTIVPPEVARYLYLDVQKARKYNDLDENTVMRMVTLNAAKALDLDHRIGSLEVGKEADMVIFDRWPMDSRTKPLRTIIEGTTYFDYAQAGSSRYPEESNR